MSVGYVRSLAGWLGLEPDEVSRAVTGARAAAGRTPARTAAADQTRGESGASGTTLTEAPPTTSEINLTELPTDPITRGERDALMAMLQHPDAVGHDLLSRAMQVRFGNPTLAVIRDGIAASIDRASAPEWMQRVGEQVPTDFQSLVIQLGVAPIPQREDAVAEYCEGVVAALVDRDLLRQKAEVLGAMQRAKSEGDQERWDRLSRESVALETERRQLRKE
jgi:DNA primase